MVGFTEEGCKEYLRLNGHNERSRAHNGEIRIYAESFRRCPEMIAIREALMQPEFTALDGLNYVLSVLDARRVRKNSPDYTAALGDVEAFIHAAIERIELGEGMHATATTQSHEKDLQNPDVDRHGSPDRDHGLPGV